MAENSIITDGSLDFSAGVDSVKVPTIASQLNPQGLARNALAWMTNCQIRDGGISQRLGWKRLGRIHAGNALYQGGGIYEPDGANPYLLLSIGGHIYQVYPDLAEAPIDLTAGFPISSPNPATVDQSYFCQGEKYMIVQAGDGVTRPLFWDGSTLRRSLGITNGAVAPGTPGINELPPGFAMDYYQGRLWYAQGRNYAAGDMVGGPSGSNASNRRDAILNVTENPLVLGGDGFTVPSNAGNIRALFHNANLNAILGEGQLMVGTRKAVYALQVPETRSDWISSTSNNQPKQTLVQLVNGPVNDRSIVRVNGDVFYQSLEPGIRSIFSSVRNFGQWGNTQISANEYRLLQFNDRSLMRWATGIEFDNRLLQGVLPKATPQGTVHQAVIPMDFIPISSFAQQQGPVWEGMYEGLNILQMFSADFGGLQRAFAVTVSALDNSIELWEFTNYLRDDENSSGESRVTRVIETPAYTWAQETLLKKLVGLELQVDKIYGTVEFKVEWRPDSDPCWKLWMPWKVCNARNSCEDVHNPVCYPITTYREGFRANMSLPRPPENCESQTGRPANIGYQHQLRITIKGWCRVRGIMLHAEPWEKRLYQNIVCA